MTAPDVELVDPGTTELLDHERRVAVAHQLLAQGVGGLSDQRGVVALHQVDGLARPRPRWTTRRRRPPATFALTGPSPRPARRGDGRRRAAPMAAMTEHTWRWAATSCTRMIRHRGLRPGRWPPARPSRRSSISRPSTTPRNVLFDADSSSG